jgi:hypothetical protein
MKTLNRSGTCPGETPDNPPIPSFISYSVVNRQFLARYGAAKGMKKI